VLLVSKVLGLCALLLAVTPLVAQTVDNTPNAGGLAEFDGPGILGRGGSNTGKHGTETLPIHVQASVNATYDSSILGYSVDSAGKLIASPSAGVEASAGVSGRKIWKRTYLGVDYGGNYTHYATKSFYNGTGQQLSLGVGTQIGRKLSLSSQIGAGTSNRFIGGPSVFQANEFEFLTAPTQELFDSRTYFLGLSTSAAYTINSRSSIRVSGNYNTVRRKARGLVDMKGYGASADYVYRVSRRTSLGVSYTFSHYDFEKIFGDSDVHVMGFHTGRKIGRDWSLSAAVTLSKQSTVGVRSFSLDPVLAAILGRNSGSEVFESNNLVYGYNFSLSRTIRRSTVSASASRGINPGNGYFLTSISQYAGVAFNHSISRDLALTGNFGYIKLTSLGFASGTLHSWSGGASVTYKLSPSFGMNAHYDWRNYDLKQTTFSRAGYRLSMGLSYFPKESVASMW
jgi:hypothetical protein